MRNVRHCQLPYPLKGYNILSQSFTLLKRTDINKANSKTILPKGRTNICKEGADFSVYFF